MIQIYEYQELKEKALSGDQEAINDLGQWFELYGDNYWNGEYYNVEGSRLYPVYGNEEYDEDGKLIQSDIISYKMI